VQTVRANWEGSSICDYTGCIYITGDTVGENKKYKMGETRRVKLKIPSQHKKMHANAKLIFILYHHFLPNYKKKNTHGDK